MEMKRAILLKKLEIVKPAVKEGMLDGTGNFVFTGKRLVAYNDRICISVPLQTDFNTSLRAASFLQAISKISAPELKLVEKKGSVTIKAGKTKAKFLGSNEGEVFDLIKELKLGVKVEGDKKHKLPLNFLDGIRRCLFSCGQDASRPYCNGITIKKNNVLSTDNNRVSEFTMSGSVPDNLLIPFSAAVNMVRYEFSKYMLRGGWLYLFGDIDTFKGLVFCTRLYNDTFPPKYKSFFEFNAETVGLPDELKDSIDTAEIFTQDEEFISKRVLISFADGEVKIKGSGNEGWIIDKIPIESKIKASFRINPVFLREILNNTNEIKVGENAIAFDIENFRHMTGLFIE